MKYCNSIEASRHELISCNYYVIMFTCEFISPQQFWILLLSKVLIQLFYRTYLLWWAFSFLRFWELTTICIMAKTGGKSILLFCGTRIDEMVAIISFVFYGSVWRIFSTSCNICFSSSVGITHTCTVAFLSEINVSSSYESLSTLSVFR